MLKQVIFCCLYRLRAMKKLLLMLVLACIGLGVQAEQPVQVEPVTAAPLVEQPAEEVHEETASKIVTTEEELEAYYIVKSIIRCEIAP